MKLLYFLLKRSWRVVAPAAIIGILSGACSAGLIAMIHTALRDDQSTSKIIVWGFIGLCLMVFVTRVLSQLLLIHLTQRVTYDLRLDLSRRILAAPVRQLEQIGSPSLLATLSEDVISVTNALTVAPSVCVNISIVVCCLIYLGYLSTTLLLAVLGAMLTGAISCHLLMVRTRRFLHLAREDQDGLFKHFRAMIEGNKELKLHHNRRKAFLTENLQSTAVSFRRHTVAGMSIYVAADSWAQILFFAVVGLLLLAAQLLLPIGKEIVAGYVLAILYMMSPLEVVLATLPALAQADIALRKIESLGLSLEENAPEKVAVAAPDPEQRWGSLELKGITHTYYREQEDRSFTFGPVDLRFGPGELVFLIGGNGSGKTTFAKLLTGLYDPEAGEIQLNGRPITRENRDSYRQLFSVVFSDFYLFEDLLGLNTGRIDVKAGDYLTKLQLNHKVRIENGKLSTTSLSQGQRKRLALLTAYLEDRPFYVFDEWAADQDPLFKEVFYTKLLPELKSKGKTVLAITHDDKYFHLADRIIKLDYGRVRPF